MFRILLIEDNLTFRENFRELLVKAFSSVTVFCAGSCKSGQESIRMMSPDLVFVDINLPDGSGLELTQKIKEIYPNIHFIVVSLYDYPEYVSAALDSGADYFISKESINMDEIASMFESLL